MKKTIVLLVSVFSLGIFTASVAQAIAPQQQMQHALHWFISPAADGIEGTYHLASSQNPTYPANHWDSVLQQGMAELHLAGYTGSDADAATIHAYIVDADAHWAAAKHDIDKAYSIGYRIENNVQSACSCTP